MKKFYNTYLLMLLVAALWFLGGRFINTIRREIWVWRNRKKRSKEASRLLWAIAHS